VVNATNLSSCQCTTFVLLYVNVNVYDKGIKVVSEHIQDGLYLMLFNQSIDVYYYASIIELQLQIDVRSNQSVHATDIICTIRAN
jgi:hypothetical protein